MASGQAWDLAAILPNWCIGHVRKWQLAGYLLMCYDTNGVLIFITVHTTSLIMVALKNLIQVLPLIAIPAVAAPNYLRLPTSATELATSAFDTAQSWIHGAISEAKVKWDQIESGVESKVHSEMVIENGIECE
jgi:hypothetical protein